MTTPNNAAALERLENEWRTAAIEQCNLTMSERRAFRHCADQLATLRATLAQPDALTGQPSGGTEAEDRFEQYVATLIDKNPDVRRLGERLADWLDEDRFNTVNPILLGICERLATHPSADAPGVALDAPHANCRARLMAEGKPYPRSTCAVCGHFAPRHKECIAALAPKPEGGHG